MPPLPPLPPPDAPPLAWAEFYLSRGLSVIPVRADGSKAPAFPGWRAFAHRHATDLELRRWFAGRYYGVGVVCGPASGNLIVWDFESEDVFLKWRAAAVANPLTAAALARNPVVITPSGGRHVWARRAAPEPGRVLARDKTGGVLIEIRGDGHQVLAPGCPACCHPTHRPYRLDAAGWLSGRAAA